MKNTMSIQYKKISKLYEKLNKEIMHASFMVNSNDSSVHNKISSDDVISMDDLLNEQGRELFVGMRHFGINDDVILIKRG